MKALPTDDGHIAYCKGCEQHHLIPNTWKFNGNLERPTFSPSLLIQYHNDTKKIDYTCHSFIVNGQWQYCSDSTHALAGKTVDMEDVE